MDIKEGDVFTSTKGRLRTVIIKRNEEGNLYAYHLATEEPFAHISYILNPIKGFRKVDLQETDKDTGGEK